MKFTIHGFSQTKAFELGLDNDELLMLRYFIDFKDSNQMYKEYMDDDMYYWVDYKSINKELPILNIGKDRAYRKFKKLVNVGVLKHKTKKKGGTFSFYTTGDRYFELLSDSPVKITEGYGENNGGGTVKITEGYGENNGTNNSSIKDYSINNSSIKDIYSLIVDYINLKTGSNFKSTTRSTREKIKARINEGFKEEDFYKVIDNKIADWKNTEYEKYLCPETLFGNKFEKYLNQKIKGNFTPNNKKSNFSDYSNQRKYDFDDLEKKLLGWDKESYDEEQDKFNGFIK